MGLFRKSPRHFSLNMSVERVSRMETFDSCATALRAVQTSEQLSFVQRLPAVNIVFTFGTAHRAVAHKTDFSGLVCRSDHINSGYALIFQTVLPQMHPGSFLSVSGTNRRRSQLHQKEGMLPGFKRTSDRPFDPANRVA